MLTIKRANLPNKVKYNGRIYCYSVKKQSNSIMVEVLSSRLKGVTDLYGYPYEPTLHYFSPAIMYSECDGDIQYYHNPLRDVHFSEGGGMYVARCGIKGTCLCPLFNMNDERLTHKNYGKTAECRKVLQYMDSVPEPNYAEALRVGLRESDRLRDSLESELNLYF